MCSRDVLTPHIWAPRGLAFDFFSEATLPPDSASYLTDGASSLLESAPSFAHSLVAPGPRPPSAAKPIRLSTGARVRPQRVLRDLR